MIRARYPILAFSTLAVVMVGYAILTGRDTSENVRNLVELQAENLAALVHCEWSCQVTPLWS